LARPVNAPLGVPRLLAYHVACNMDHEASANRSRGDEYPLLRRRAAAEGKSIKEVAREALRAHLLPDQVNPKDPVFLASPLIRAKGKTTWSSRDDDKLPYRRSQ
jgi:hypothetical protein